MSKADIVVIDPPFITKEVWDKYAITAKLLLKTGIDNEGTEVAANVDVNFFAGRPNGKVILTTVLENAPLLKDLFDASPTVRYSGFMLVSFSLGISTQHSTFGLSV